MQHYLCAKLFKLQILLQDAKSFSNQSETLYVAFLPVGKVDRDFDTSRLAMNTHLRQDKRINVYPLVDWYNNNGLSLRC